ncbi:nucleotidyltransferase substrate binding protein [Hydrogenivirga sp. 128-5-R1-1]|uniref:nucleotidyltransferase substrate binding protein n=1 Tax=Hydrogenivirga sp. 128-5-R1-1 TaxID=392423 RepID=UPI001E339DA7|nr:nucleotidyltransferase substrate binding protein [Hydrogenivirga sp. 128-5-R1-1]
MRNLQETLPAEILYEVTAKRFEYTYEALWKTIRLFLLEEKGIECNSPMDCFKALYSVGLIDEKHSEDIPKIVRMRNNIVHIYDFSLAEDLFKFIREKVIPVFGSIIKALRDNCAK